MFHHTLWMRLRAQMLLVLGLSLAVGTPRAQEAATNPHDAAMRSAVAALQSSRVLGPSTIQLKDQATLKLPAGYMWVPQPAAGQFMQALGNPPSERELGLIFSTDTSANWMVLAEFEPAGYIKDDDAKQWDIEALFNNLKEGTEAANETRKQQGYPEMEIIGWIEKPAYTADKHRLVWSISARHKGAAADEPASINYNTYALGREGYVTLNLITDLKTVDHDKVHVQALLNALDFDEGKRYADFNASTDKVAEYGLAALVGGLAAKKLGFFALMAGFFAKFAKVILLAGGALVAGAAKFLKRDKGSPST